LGKSMNELTRRCDAVEVVFDHVLCFTEMLLPHDAKLVDDLTERCVS
jgi:hypothetical protein